MVRTYSYNPSVQTSISFENPARTTSWARNRFATKLPSQSNFPRSYFATSPRRSYSGAGSERYSFGHHVRDRTSQNAENGGVDLHNLQRFSGRRSVQRQSSSVRSASKLRENAMTPILEESFDIVERTNLCTCSAVKIFKPKLTSDWSKPRHNYKPISLPKDKARFVMPVLSGAPLDPDAQLRQMDKEHKRNYGADLRRQMAEQATIRARQNNTHGYGQNQRTGLQNQGIGFQDLDRQLKLAQKEEQQRYMKELEQQMTERKNEPSSTLFNNGGGPITNNLSMDDVVRQAKLAERQKTNQYMRELQEQIAEQKMRRAQSEILYGGKPPREMMKASKQLMGYSASEPDDPPWLRGNPQPKTGIRARQNLQPQASERHRSLPHDFNYGISNSTQTGLSDNTNDLFGSPSSFLPSSFHQQPQEASRMPPANPGRTKPALSPELEPYDPWGKGGGGAPVRDKNGKIITDRRKLQRSWNQVIDSNIPHENGVFQSASNSFNAGQTDPLSSSLPLFPPADFNDTFGAMPINSQLMMNGNAVPLSEKEQTKQDLLLQIAERKRQKEMERQQQKEEEERDRWRIERDMEKMKKEAEEEKRKQEQKKVDQEKKAAALAANMQKLRDNVVRKNQPVQRRRSTPKKDDGLEWWEKAPRQASGGSRRARRNSYVPTPPIKPVVEAEPPETAVYDTYESLEGEKDSDMDEEGEDKLSERRSRPAKIRSALVRNENTLRRISARRERLTKEQIRVQSALRRRQYGEDVFSDDEESNLKHPSTSMPRSSSLNPRNGSSLQRSPHLSTTNGSLMARSTLNTRTNSSLHHPPSNEKNISFRSRKSITGQLPISPSSSHRPMKSNPARVTGSETGFNRNVTGSETGFNRNNTMHGFLSDSEDEVEVREWNQGWSDSDDTPDQTLNSFLRKRDVGNYNRNY